MKVLSYRSGAKGMMAMALAAIAAVGAGSTAWAHVVVRPSEVLTASYQTFTVSVPNERDAAVVALKLEVPSGLDHVTPTVKPGWQVGLTHDGDDQLTKVTVITWRGGSIDAGMRDDFSFSAQAPASVGQLDWKAYQTYADGTVVSWDQAEQAMTDTSGPFSVTQVVNDDSQAAPNSMFGQVTFYLALASLVVALAGLYIALRSRPGAKSR